VYKIPIIKSEHGLYKELSSEYMEDALFWQGMWVTSYQKNFYVDCTTIEISSIEEFYELLSELDKMPNEAIMRAIAGEGELTNVTRRTTGEDAPFSDGKINWVCIDLDSCDLPEGIIEEEIPEFCMYYFPEYFHNVSYVAQFSNRAGFDGWKQAKMHYWFLLDEGVTNDELKRWQTHNKQFDPSVFKTVQPIYTSAPKQSGSLKELEVVKQRVRFYKKEKDTVHIDIPEESLMSAAAMNGEYSESNYNNGEKFMRFIDQITTSGAHEYTKSAVASYYTKYGVNCDWNHFKNVVLARMQAVGHPRANMQTVNDEVEGLLIWARRVGQPHNHLPYDQWILQEGNNSHTATVAKLLNKYREKK